jgi:5,6-dimethylbenzimidazole synthase
VSQSFDAEFRARLHQLFAWRRDVRRFRRDRLPEGTLERLIAEAALAPSVGLSQPWRFVIVEEAERRAAILDNFIIADAEAARGYDPARAQHYRRLKLAGLREAPCQLAVFADPGTALGHGLGRATMPQTVEYSSVAAITLLWLAARAEGIGMGWVSILDPSGLCRTLDVPETWCFIGYFCLGLPESDNVTPELQREGWEARIAVDEIIVRR